MSDFGRLRTSFGFAFALEFALEFEFVYFAMNGRGS
jgi:hypothetical protein